MNKIRILFHFKVKFLHKCEFPTHHDVEQKEYNYIESDFLSSSNVYFSADDCIEFFLTKMRYLYTRE